MITYNDFRRLLRSHEAALLETIELAQIELATTRQLLAADLSGELEDINELAASGDAGWLADYVIAAIGTRR